MTFEKIEVKNKSSFVTEQILDAIREGEYGDGDKLPPERKIAEQMGVSRPSVREALSALSVTGVIESRSGDGTYVKDPDNLASLEAKALSVLERDEDPYAIAEARRVVEGGLMPIVVERATQEDLSALEGKYREMCEMADRQDYDNFFLADRNFHLILAKITDNSFLMRTLRSLVNVMKEQLWQEIKRQYYLRENSIFDTCENHKKIIGAIKDRDVEQAIRAMRYHFKEFGDTDYDDAKRVG